MANRNFASAGKLYSMHVFPVLLDANFAVGASGAVSDLKGPAVQSVTRLAAGIYQVQLQDKYNKYFIGSAQLSSPAPGSDVADGSFVVGTPYVITLVGTTDWSAVGFPTGVTPAVGAAFVATTVGGAGTGTAKAVTVSGISSVEVIGQPNLTITNSLAQPNQGSIFLIQTLGPTSSSVTTMIAKDPANGSRLAITAYLSNSSVTIQGE